MKPKLVEVRVWLQPVDVAMIDRLAAKDRCGRSAVVRTLVEWVLIREGADLE